MYLSHFNLKEKPFQITPDPRFLWLGEKHQEALATLRYGVLDRKGFLLLTGDVGTGKTTLIKALLNSLDDNTVVATLVDPHLDKLEFFEFIGDIFGIHKGVTRKVDFLTHFTEFLLSAHEAGKTVLLIIDEAQRLSKELLEEIRLLSNIEKQHMKLLNIFFVGQNEFNALLMESDSRALRQRITITYQIQPLTENETHEYVKFRLKVAGTEQPIFDKKAIREIFRFSKGYPRLINTICDHALLTAYVRDTKKVQASTVKECAKELTLPNEKVYNGPAIQNTTIPPRKSRFLPKAAFFVCLMLLMATGGYLIDPSIFNRVSYKITDFYGHWLGTKTVTLAEPEKANTDREEEQPNPTYENEVESVSLHSVPVPLQPNTLFEGTPNEEVMEGLPTSESPVQATEPVSSPNNTQESVGDEPNRATEIEEKSEPPIFLAEDFEIVVPFNYDTNALSSEAQGDLNRLAAAMANNLDMEIAVTGYTDTLGSHSYNVKLSEFRAHVVKSYLVAKGINPLRIQVNGMAEANPRETNDTSEGRALNRRVEIRLKTSPDARAQ
jgi:general secretion pathway protein A